MKRLTKYSLVFLSAITLAACGGKNNDNNPNVGENNANNTNNGMNNPTNNPTNNPVNNPVNNPINNPTNNETNNMMGMPGTCDAYCDTVMANCTAENAQYSSRDECVDYCENVAGWDAGVDSDVDGNTIGCRTYHGGDPAATDPATHCAHAGPSGGGVCGSYCDSYCQLALQNCAGGDELYADEAACMTACGGFDDTGTPGDVQYDTVQCRIYHAGAPAATDPATHCPHSGETPTAFCVGDVEDFVFRTDPPGDYTRVDRMGMPAVSTALIASKDDYNDADPTDDVAGTYVSEIVATLNVLHGALDADDLIANNGLTPCDMADNNGDMLPDCVGQEVVPGGPTVAGLVLPDTIKIDPAGASGFPNGRGLADPVIDVTLAVILLDMTVHSPTLLAGLPLNPPQNDVGVEGAFLTTFPYLHPPHMP